LLLPALAAAKRKAQRISCVNNLKQIGLAFRTWEGDNGDRYPMAVSTAQGGAEECVYSWLSASTVKFAMTNVFVVMSNEITNPKLLYCPSDLVRGPGTTNFAVLGAVNWTNYISYFVCGDTVETYPQMLLDGDRSMGTMSAVNTPAPLIDVSTIAGATYYNPNINYWAWSANDMHLRAGNVGMADGSVQQLSVPALQSALLNATNGTAWGYVYYNFPQ
jgi:prepilin-type processing-associated H-X9-DG protein